MRATAVVRIAGVLLGVALVLAGCNGTDDADLPDDPSPTPSITEAHTPDPPTLDEDTAADLFIQWREIVYALPPTQPEAIDAVAASEGIVAPDSDAADWVAQELQLARERGVIVRGTVHAEALTDPLVTGDRATAAICSSADLHGTEVATGEPLSDDQSNTAYTPFATVYRRIGDRWTIESAARKEGEDCVPPSLHEELTQRWELFTEAWYERDRQGGGPELGRLTEVITDRFADTLRQLPARDPVSDPEPYTNFETVSATRTTATGQACRSGGRETVDWMLVDGRWRVDFAGQEGRDPTPCS